MRLNLYIIFIFELVLPSWQQDSSEGIDALLNILIEQTNNKTDLNKKSDGDSNIIIVKTFQEPIDNNEPVDRINNTTNLLNSENLNTRRSYGSDPKMDTPKADNNDILKEIIIEVESPVDSQDIKPNDEDKTKKLLGEFLSESGRSILKDNIHTWRPDVPSGDNIFQNLPSEIDDIISNESKINEGNNVSDNLSNIPRVLNEYVPNKEMTPSTLNTAHTNNKEIPQRKIRLPIKTLIEKILRTKSLRTEHPISRQGNVRYVLPENPSLNPITDRPILRIIEKPLTHDSLTPNRFLHGIANRHIHYPINHYHLPYIGTNLQTSPWVSNYALQNALMRTSSLQNVKHFNYVTDLTNKMVSRFVYQPLYRRFL